MTLTGTQSPIGQPITESDRFAEGINAIFFRTRSNNVGDSIELKDIVVNGQAYSGNVLSNNSDTIDYLRVTGISSNFTVTGNVVFNWVDGSRPNSSALAFQAKMGYYEIVPEPNSMSLLSLGFLSTIFAGSRKRKFER